MGRLKKRGSIILIISIILIVACVIFFQEKVDSEKCVPTNPEFSVESGMYDSDFPVSINSQNGAKIYYTTDGSEPNENSTLYTKPITITNISNQENSIANMGPDLITGKSIYTAPVMNVDKGTVIRAIAISDTGDKSDVITKTYFVGINSARYNNLPIISLTTNPYNLFDYTNGIYILGKTFDDYMSLNPKQEFDGSVPANYNRRGKAWEREAHLEYFDTSGKLQLSQDMGIRVQGAYSRANIQKSFALYAREKYGDPSFDYNFFGNEDNQSFTKLVLQSIEETKYVDPYVSLVTQDLDVDTVTSYQPTVVFIDGEYWGVYTLRESVSVDYIARKYDLNVDDVLMTKADGYGDYKIESGRARDIGQFYKMIDFAEQYDLSDDKNYQQICEMMDINSFVDWVCTEIYLGNNDCIKPGRPDNNVRIWRVMSPDPNNKFADGKWRWILFDTDKTSGYSNNYTYNDIHYRLFVKNDRSHMQRLFLGLMDNAEFKQLVIDKFQYLCNDVFNQGKNTIKWATFSIPYTSQLERYFARFPSTEPDVQKSLERVNSINDFYNYRPFFVAQMISEIRNYSKEQ